MDQVILFSSGVGYFQREGEVDGHTRIDLPFPATDVNDLLKSLVLQDLGGGTISTISYDSPDPIDRTLRSFALDLTGNPSFGQILNQARGQKIEVTLLPNSSQPGTLTGTVVGMESQRQPAGKDIIDVDLLNLNCAQGLRSVSLSQVQSVRFLNPVLDGEFKRALEVLASAHDTQKKLVSFDFHGNGKRPVRVGYVVENPIWKTSYRLVLDKKGKRSLQGWAMVENTTDEDWNHVRMVLVSGRPISYQMDLYQPLYIPRPKVEPELFASLRPPTYSGALQNVGVGGFGGGALGLGGGGLGMGGLPGSGQFGQQGGMYGLQGGLGQQGYFPGNRYQQLGIGGGSAGLNVFNPGGQQAGTPADREMEEDLARRGGRLTYEEFQERLAEKREAKQKAKAEGKAVAAMDITESIAPVATNDDLGHSSQYVIDQRISLARQKSALLPIVSHAVEAGKVSIYNEAIHAKHPLLGLRFKNTSGRHLMQGPMTVYEGGSYAGDARIADLQPNEERFVSYAVDLGTEIKTETKIRPGPDMEVKFSAKDASLQAQFKVRQTTTYLIKNRSEEDRAVILEHPIRGSWKLVTPDKPAERSRNSYRFQASVGAGQTVKHDVIEEEDRADSFTPVSSSDEAPHYDLGSQLHITTAVKTSAEELSSLTIIKGSLHAGHKVRENKTYFIRNSSDQDRVLTIHHFVRPEWRHVAAARRDESGPAFHTFQLTIPKAKTVHQEIAEERVNLIPGQPIKALPEAALRDFLASKVPSPAVRAALERILAANVKRRETSRQLAEQEQQFRAILDDQARLRANLEKVPQTSAAYKRYLQKLETQETEIETFQTQIKRLQSDVRQQQKEYEEYVTGLTVE
jgi:hypothetical protein